MGSWFRFFYVDTEPVYPWGIPTSVELRRNNKKYTIDRPGGIELIQTAANQVNHLA